MLRFERIPVHAPCKKRIRVKRLLKRQAPLVDLLHSALYPAVHSGEQDLAHGVLHAALLEDGPE